jgi:CBS domain-containing protein
VISIPAARAGREFSILSLVSEWAIFPTGMAGAGTVGVLLARKKPAVWSISPDATVFEAIQLMADKNVGALPVIDNSRLVGIISERDYARKVILKGRFSKDTPVRDIMTQALLTATPSDSIAECIRVMTEKRVRHLPVLEGTKMIGIVSIGDVLKWFFRPKPRQSTTSNDV